MPEDKEKNEALAEWRKKNWRKILKKNQKVLEEIRDNPEAKDGDRTDAIKALNRMADIMTAEKVQVNPEKKKEIEWWEEELTPAEAQEIGRITNNSPK